MAGAIIGSFSGCTRHLKQSDLPPSDETISVSTNQDITANKEETTQKQEIFEKDSEEYSDEVVKASAKATINLDDAPINSLLTSSLFEYTDLTEKDIDKALKLIHRIEKNNVYFEGNKGYLICSVLKPFMDFQEQLAKRELTPDELYQGIKDSYDGSIRYVKGNLEYSVMIDAKSESGFYGIDVNVTNISNNVSLLTSLYKSSSQPDSESALVHYNMRYVDHHEESLSLSSYTLFNKYPTDYMEASYDLNRHEISYINFLNILGALTDAVEFGYSISEAETDVDINGILGLNNSK